MNDNVLIASPPPPAARLGAAPRAAARLVQIELRRNPMIAMLPLAAALFWYQAYRHIMALPPLWNVRTMTLQNDALLDFAMPVTGAAAWVGWREQRRQLSELLAGTPRQPWARRLAAWAATTCWALAGYVACVTVVYGITSRQATWGGPLWWPAVVGAVGIPALTAFGFVAGAMAPSRFTAPLVTIAAFFGLGYSSTLATSDHSFWQLSPLVAGSAGIGADPGVATFYPYLPDLSIAQVMFLGGITLALLGVLGLPSRPWRIRASAAMLAAAGLAAAGTAVGLAGAARLDPHGMTVIPALHDAASDQPVSYTPACGGTGIAICVHPAYAAYLPDVTGALEPMLRAVAGLPGAPAALHQAPQVYEQGPGNSINVPAATGHGPKFLLPPLPGTEGAISGTDFAAQLAADTAVPIVTRILGVSPDGPATPAQQAIVSALTHLPYAQARMLGVQPGLLASPGSPAAAAAQRFAALPVAAQHAWLAAHLTALRSGTAVLAQLP
jgi:hypothetical protein